ncbi:MAG: hypothetical protein JNK38_01055 [Acidobacteria bacterium]|nr:hypothetical protein [Acidobacteriota bacterium]
MGKLPAIQFYPADWRKDPGVQSLSFHDRGVWLEIICLMHESEQRGRLLLNGKPMPDEALARLLGLDKQIVTKTISTLLEYGVASIDPETGALMNRRMVRDENLRAVRQAAGKMGGNPALLKQKETTGVKQKETTGVKQNLTPSSSSSSAFSITQTAGAHEAPFSPEFSPDAEQQTAAIDEIAKLLCDLHEIQDGSGWLLRDKFQGLAAELHGVQANTQTIRAFWSHRRVKPQIQYFVQDFIAWRAGQKGNPNGSNKNGNSKPAGDRWKSGTQL